ncbi:MAG: leucine-rich repeat domain-containing protein, partial [Eubacterium sp.]|nr:leucine-rich repeat domain-containing protein [Eubacterium sp.]
SATDTKTWNTNVGYSRSGSSSQSQSVSQSLAKKISDSVSYNMSNTVQESHVSTEGTTSTQSNSREYASTLTYYTEEQETSAIKISNADAPEGYYRVVCAGKMHVFAVVNYDIATNSYGVYTFNVLEDDVYDFLDYSKDTPSFDDYENGVLPFEVPYEVNNYIDNLVGASDGLKVDLDTGKIVRYTGEDRVVVVPQYLSVDTGDENRISVKITGIEAGAFAGKDIIAVRLPESVTEIPAGSFENCSNLVAIDAESVTEIGQNAFSGCSSLKEFDISENVTSLGTNAFIGVQKVVTTARSADIAKAAAGSGAKNIILNLASIDGTLENDKLVVPTGVDYVQINGGNRAFTNVQIISDASETVINGINLKDSLTPSLKISSGKLGLNRVSANSDSWALVLSAESTEISLFGTNQLKTASQNAVLCKNIGLTDTGSSVIGKLKVTGDILICGDITGEDLLELTDGTIKKISASEYNAYLNDTWTDWSEWSATPVEATDDVQVETKVQYRYSDKQTTTSTNSSLSGWTKYDQTTTWGAWGNWSSWSGTAQTKSDSKDVQTRTEWRYYYFYCPKCGGHEPLQGKSDCGNYTLSSSDAKIGWFPTAYKNSNSSTYSYATYKRYTSSLGDGQRWNFSSGNLNSTAVGTKDTDSDAVVIRTGYRYRTRSQTTTYYFYKWSDWSSWSDEVQTSNDNKQVETRTVYRYKSRIM